MKHVPRIPMKCEHQNTTTALTPTGERLGKFCLDCKAVIDVADLSWADPEAACTCCPTHRLTMADVTPDKSAPDLPTGFIRTGFGGGLPHA